MREILEIIGSIAFLLFGIAQIWAGYIGIDLHLGMIWAFIAIFLVFARFTLPITVGAFFGAMDVWHWHWALAALFVAPGLIFIIPGIITEIILFLKRKR